MRFKVGDRVFYTRYEQTGVIIEVDVSETTLPYRIYFENGLYVWACVDDIDAHVANTKPVEIVVCTNADGRVETLALSDEWDRENAIAWLTGEVPGPTAITIVNVDVSVPVVNEVVGVVE